MTGFGQSSGANARHLVTVSLRSVNHRNLDVSIRLKEELRAFEPEVRRVVAAWIRRGRIELTVDVQSLEAPIVEVQVAHATIEALQRIADELATRHGIDGELRFRDLLQLPEVVSIRSEPATWAEEDAELLLSTTEEALRLLVLARRREGDQLATVFAGKLAELTEQVVVMTDRAASVRQTIQEGIERRLGDLLGDRAVMEEGRLVQEAAILAERADVSEEIDRLGAHVGHVQLALQDETAVGRRVDFLIQEMMRELNTLGAKSRDTAMTLAVVEAKLVCEQLREQVQNVE